MPNSLPRLLDGMVQALLDDVLPTVDDEYARAQLAACAELLANLATRVEWRRDQLAEVTARAEQAVDEFLAAAPNTARDLPARADGPDPVARRDAALDRVSAAIRWGDGRPTDDERDTAVREFARWHLELERSLLRTGMFR